MSADTSQRKSVRFNLLLLLAGLKRWPTIATVILTLVLGAIAVQLVVEKRSDIVYIAAHIFGYTSALFGMKAIFYLMIYTRLHKERFPGSLLVATGIAMIPVFFFYACAFYILSVQREEVVSVVAIIILFGLGYPLFTVFIAGFLHFQQTIQLAQVKARERRYLQRAKRSNTSPSP